MDGATTPVVNNVTDDDDDDGDDDDETVQSIKRIMMTVDHTGYSRRVATWRDQNGSHCEVRGAGRVSGQGGH